MKKKAIVAAIFLNVILMTAHPAAGLSGKHVVALKKAGISDRTIQIIAEEKVIETAAFSVDDIVQMKQAGLQEETLRMLIKESSFLRKSKSTIIYGTHTKTLRFASVQDVIELKQAELSDDVIQAIIAVSGERYDAQRAEAFDLLRSMGIVVDTRGNRSYRRGGH